MPRFLIIGAQKCGTTWLHHHLANHPQLFLPEGKDDEFFSYRPVRPLERYREKFAAAGDGITCGDSCASYLWSPHPDYPLPEHFNPEIPQTVRDALGPDCRLIVLLKDPVARTLSAYLHHIAHGSLDPNQSLFDASDLLGLVALSRYGCQLRHWLSSFPAEQVLVVPGPGSSNADVLLRRVTTFLGVGEHTFRDPESVVYGGLRRRIDDGGLWVSLGQRGLTSMDVVQRPCPTRIHQGSTEVRLVNPLEIAALRALLKEDTAEFAALANTHSWSDPAFAHWQTWPDPAKRTDQSLHAISQLDSTAVDASKESSFLSGTNAQGETRQAILKTPIPPQSPDRPVARFVYRWLPLPVSAKRRVGTLYRHLESLFRGRR